MAKYSRASDIGQAAICPHALYLQKQKSFKPNKSAIVAMKKGNDGHDALNKTVKQSSQPIKLTWWLLLATLIGIIGLVIAWN